MISGAREPHSAASPTAICGWRFWFYGELPPCHEPIAIVPTSGQPVSDARCVLHSSDINKDRDAFWARYGSDRSKDKHDFVGWVFPGVLDLANEIWSTAGFAGAQFLGGANFSRLTIAHSADFNRAVFLDKAECPLMRFNGDAYFNGTHFRGVANFTGATFAQHASFFGAEFYDDTFFASGVRFEKGSRFVKTKFHRGVSFDDVWFAESAVFDGCAIRPPQPSYTALGTILGNFMRADLHNVVFRSCTLSDAELSGAYAIDQAEYENITWGEIGVRHPITGHSKTVREVISEERSARETDDPQDFGSAERIYRNLRRSYEGHRRFILAAAFWARELEMRRMSRLAGQTGWRRTLANYETPEAWYAALKWLRPGHPQATFHTLRCSAGIPSHIRFDRHPAK
jgi:uncharacterized protein YjbI with pentapeptide repeats